MTSDTGSSGARAARYRLSGISSRAVENFSGRLDQVVGEKGRIFARYANVPSRSTTDELEAANAGFRWASATLGATMQWGAAIHDFRFNFSRVVNTSSWTALSSARAGGI